MENNNEQHVNNKDSYKKNDNYKKDDNYKNIYTDKLDILSKIEKNISPFSKFANYNEERIAIGKLCQKYLVREDLNLIYSCYTTDLFNARIFTKNYMNNIIVKYWLKFSSNVITNRSIGFPIVFKLMDDGNKCILLYENLKKYLYKITSNDFILNKDISDQIMFQKLFIIYQMYLNNCYSDCYLFNIYNIPRTKIIFKVKDIFFEFTVTRLVILSENTNFVIQTNVSEDVYISKVSDSDYTLHENNSFIKMFLYTFKNYISFFYILSKIPPIIEEQRLMSFIPGEYACLKVRDNVISVIILSHFDDLCEVIQLSQNAHIIMNVNKDQLIRKPKTIYNRMSKNILNYIIGDENY